MSSRHSIVREDFKHFSDVFMTEEVDPGFITSFTGSPADIETLKGWLKTLRLRRKAPRGMKKLIADLLFIEKQFNAADQFRLDTNQGSMLWDNIRNTISRWSPEDVNLINAKLSSKEGEDIMKLNGVTYVNRSVLSDKGFKEKVKIADGVLRSLKGFHKKALLNLTVHFVKRAESKTAARYLQAKDIIVIRPDRAKNNPGYGHFPYVLVHELGHRYEKFHRQRVEFDRQEWWTTKYSQRDTMSGGEQFAELFALSNWESSYPEHKDKIERFRDVIN